MQLPLKNTAWSIIRVGFQGKVVQTIASLTPACSTITSVLDLFGVNIEEESRSAIFAGVRTVDDAWSHVLGADDRLAVQRIDTTLLGLSSSVVELCLVFPSEADPIELAGLEAKLSRALEHAQRVECVVGTCVPGQFYFNLRSASSYTPVFCVRIATQQKTRMKRRLLRNYSSANVTVGRGVRFSISKRTLY